MTLQDKFTLVLQAIKEAQTQLASNPDPIFAFLYLTLTISTDKILKNKITLHEASAIFDQLERIDKVITVYRPASNNQQKQIVAAWEVDKITGKRTPLPAEPPPETGKTSAKSDFTFEILPNFDPWYADYLAKINGKIEAINGKFEIKYSFGGEITLNGELLHKTDFDSENDKVFRYLSDHPNINITTSRLMKEAGLKRIKSLSKILDNLKFTGDLRKAFFRISKDTISFRNPVYQEDLKTLKISYLKIPKLPC